MTSNNPISTYVFLVTESRVRAMEIDGEPWFVAKDVAETLGYARSENAITQHCKGSQTCPLKTGGQVRHVIIIPE